MRAGFLALSFALVTSGLRAEDVWAPRKPQPAPVKYNRSFGSFPALRGELLNLISQAKERVWLYSGYLTDGELVTALFLAKYRNLDVQVILGKEKANAYLSRIHTLQQQDTPVAYLPDDMRLGHPSGVLIDNQLYVIDSELDFRSKNSAFSVRSVPPTEADQVAQRLARVTGRPAVSRATPTKTPPPRSTGRQEYQGEKNGVYNYNKSTTVNELRRNVPKSLPRAPKYQLEKRNKVQTPAPTPPPASSSSGSSRSVWK